MLWDGGGSGLRSRGPQVRRLPGAPTGLRGTQAFLEAAPEARFPGFGAACSSN